jgi:hypothetical protein
VPTEITVPAETAPTVTGASLPETTAPGDTVPPTSEPAGGGQDCQISVAAGAFPQLSQNTPDYRLFPALNRVILHEVGHALGLEHEHVRLGANLCEKYRPILIGCQHCQAQEAIDSTCLGSDYNACLQPEPGKEQESTARVPISTKDHNEIAGRIAQYGGNPGVVPLTVYDAASIVNYCAMEEYGGPRREADYLPTPLDYLGVSMLYPQLSHALGCKSGCFKTEGSFVVNDSGQLASDWTTLGALNITPAWVTSSWSGTGEVLSATHLPSNSGSVSFSYSYRGQTHNGAGTVTKSNAKFAALLGACQRI